LSPSLADHPLRPAIDRRLGRPLPHQPANRTRAAPSAPCGFPLTIERQGVCGISHPFGQLFPTYRYVTHALLSRLPLDPKVPCDLHVLGTPPAFTLSQDQTLHHDLTDVAFDPFGTLDRSRASKESVSAICCCLHPRRSCVHTSSRSLLLSGTLSTETHFARA